VLRLEPGAEGERGQTERWCPTSRLDVHRRAAQRTRHDGWVRLHPEPRPRGTATVPPGQRTQGSKGFGSISSQSTSIIGRSTSAAATWMVAMRPGPRYGLCRMTVMPCASQSAITRRISPMPPSFVTLGCASSIAPASISA
jgi:hypothetical protein